MLGPKVKVYTLNTTECTFNKVVESVLSKKDDIEWNISKNGALTIDSHKKIRSNVFTQSAYTVTGFASQVNTGIKAIFEVKTSWHAEGSLWAFSLLLVLAGALFLKNYFIPNELAVSVGSMGRKGSQLGNYTFVLFIVITFFQHYRLYLYKKQGFKLVEEIIEEVHQISSS